jgi:hypothetical protein
MANNTVESSIYLLIIMLILAMIINTPVNMMVYGPRGINEEKFPM